LGEELPDDFMPDWLKSATEEPSMPPPGALSDWFRETSTPSSPASPGSAPSGVSPASSLSGEDVDSLFTANIPDWLAAPGTGSQPADRASDSLAPVDLPSWVQAMRPVESVMEEVSEVEEAGAEREGPLAGLSGVIPAAPIGSSRRPKAVSLKLAATDEQQTAAILLEKILEGESNPRAEAAQPLMTTQKILRWSLAAFFIIVLGSLAYLRTEFTRVPSSLPEEARSVSSVIARLPQNPLVLVVMDYDPGLAPEMEAVSGPVLDHLALATRARLVFVSTSPNGTALVRRLLTKSGLSLPAPDGLDYKPGENYVNLGYLPGGFAGVREFIESPSAAIPQAGVASFSEYAAVFLLTDHAESGRVWVEQLYARNQADAAFFAFQPILVASSAQAAPMLQPYFSSQQITGMLGGLSDAARYEFVNNSRIRNARLYFDSFGIGLLLAAGCLVAGSAWNLIAGISARRQQEAA
jgi:hypothetical protein